MILKGSQRGSAMELGVHLLKADNEHVELHELRGFMSESVLGAMKEIQAVARGTRCRQPLFSVSFNPPDTEAVSIASFERAIEEVETANGLMANGSRPVSSFEDSLRTALEFLSNPCNLWHSKKLGDRRAALKLTFSDRLRYKAKEGFRTPLLSLPFNMLHGASVGVEGMVGPAGLEPAT